MRLPTRAFASAVGLLLLATGLGCQPSTPGAPPSGAPTTGPTAKGVATSFRLGHAAATSHPYHDGAMRFADAAAKATNGAVTVEIFPARQLGDEAPLLQQVQLGAVDAAIVSTAVVAASVPAANAFQLPFLIPNYDVAAAAYTSGSTARILDKLGPARLKGLAVYEGGFRHFLSTKGPIRSPADFANLKTRIVPVPLHLDIWNALGGNPTPMAYGEVYTGLQTKVIDSVEINVSSVFGEKFYEVAKDFTLTGQYMFPGILFFNADKFAALPADQQKALVDAAQSTVKPQVEEAKRQDAAQLDELKKLGLNVYEVNDLGPFKAKTQPVFDKYIALDPVIKDFADEVLKLAGGH